MSVTDKRHTIVVKPHTGLTASQAFVAWCEGSGSPAQKHYGATEAEAIAKVERALEQAPMTDHTEFVRDDLLTAAQARIEALTAERDAFRAVLEAAEYKHIDQISSVEHGRALGELAAQMTRAVVEDAHNARAERDAAMARAEQAEALSAMLIVAMNALLDAPKGVVPTKAAPFYDGAKGRFCTALRATEGGRDDG